MHDHVGRNVLIGDQAAHGIDEVVIRHRTVDVLGVVFTAGPGIEVRQSVVEHGVRLVLELLEDFLFFVAEHGVAAGFQEQRQDIPHGVLDDLFRDGQGQTDLVDLDFRQVLLEGRQLFAVFLRVGHIKRADGTEGGELDTAGVVDHDGLGQQGLTDHHGFLRAHHHVGDHLREQDGSVRAAHASPNLMRGPV